MKSIVGDEIIDRETILGAVCLVFWTLTIQTYFKYIGLVIEQVPLVVRRVKDMELKRIM